MGEETRSSTRRSSRFSLAMFEGASYTFGSSDAGLEDALQYLSGAMIARGDVDSRQSRRSSRLSITPFSVDSHHFEENDGTGVSTLLCTCLTANYISVGYLLVPWAFANAGLLLTTVVFSLVMLQSFITSTYVMETCARAEFLASHSVDKVEANLDCSYQSDEQLVLSHGVPSPGTEPPISPGTERELDEEPSERMTVPEPQPPSEERETNLSESTPWWHHHLFEGAVRNQEQITSKSQGLHAVQAAANSLLPDIRNRKFEMPELCRIFMGEVWRIMFTFAACCDLYGLMWSIAAVSASSLASEFPILHNPDDYMLYVLIFAIIVIPMSFLSIADQIWIQIAFFGGRMLMVIMMLITVAAAFGASEPHFGDQNGPQRTSPVANFSMLSFASQVCIFSTAFQYSVPVIAEALTNKSNLRRVYGGSTGFICGSVLILSLVLASYFGNDLMEKSSNVNWSVYHGGTGSFDEESGKFVGVAWWALLVSKFIVLYPAVDGISNFVLCAVAVGEITTGAWYGDLVHSLEPSWKRRLFFRLVGSVPPLLGAVFVSDLSAIANYAGLFTVASYTICPCLLQVYSSRIIKQAGFGTKTSYGTIFSSEGMAWTVAMLGAAMIFYAVIGSILFVSSDR